MADAKFGISGDGLGDAEQARVGEEARSVSELWVRAIGEWWSVECEFETAAHWCLNWLGEQNGEGAVSEVQRLVEE